jgi:hypothetical protein
MESKNDRHKGSAGELKRYYRGKCNSQRHRCLGRTQMSHTSTDHNNMNLSESLGWNEYEQWHHDVISQRLKECDMKNTPTSCGASRLSSSNIGVDVHIVKCFFG